MAPRELQERSQKPRESARNVMHGSGLAMHHMLASAKTAGRTSIGPHDGSKVASREAQEATEVDQNGQKRHGSGGGGTQRRQDKKGGGEGEEERGTSEDQNGK